MPPRNTLTQSFPNCTFPILSEILDRNLRLLEGVSTTNKAPGSGSNGGASPSRTLLVEAEANTWSRSARRSPSLPSTHARPPSAVSAFARA